MSTYYVPCTVLSSENIAENKKDFKKKKKILILIKLTFWDRWAPKKGNKRKEREGIWVAIDVLREE